MRAAQLDPALQGIVRLRMTQLGEHVECDLGELVHLIVIEPGDPPDAVIAELGFSILTNLVDSIRFGDPDFEPSWEWIERHDGGWYELVFVMTDDGFGHVVFVQDHEGVDADLLALCREYAPTA